MTNEMIVLNARFELMKQGKVGSTGRTVEYVGADGKTVSVPEPEEIHTFARWKGLGFSVKKGEKAIAKLPIWKRTAKVNDETGEEEDARMFMKTSAFFARHQVSEVA